MLLNPTVESKDNPLRFHANLDDLTSEEESEEEKPKKQLYVPPKIAAVPYSEKGEQKE